MAIDWETIFVGTIVGTITIIISVPLSMLLKDWLKRQFIVRDLNKAGNVVGVGGEVLRNGLKYKVEKIDTHGVRLKGEFQIIFVPLEAWLHEDKYLPDAEYDTKLANYVEREFGQAMKIIMPQVIQQTKEALIQELGSGGLQEIEAAMKSQEQLPPSEFKVIGDRKN